MEENLGDREREGCWLSMVQCLKRLGRYKVERLVAAVSIHKEEQVVM